MPHVPSLTKIFHSIFAELLDNRQQRVIDVLVHDDREIGVRALRFPVINNGLVHPFSGHGEFFGRIGKNFTALSCFPLMRRCGKIAQECCHTAEQKEQSNIFIERFQGCASRSDLFPLGTTYCKYAWKAM